MPTGVELLDARWVAFWRANNSAERMEWCGASFHLYFRFLDRVYILAPTSLLLLGMREPSVKIVVKFGKCLSIKLLNISSTFGATFWRSGSNDLVKIELKILPWRCW